MSNLINTLDQFEQCVGKALSYVRRRCEKDGKTNPGLLDQYQQVVSDLAVSTAELQCSRNYLDYASSRGDIEQKLSNCFAAESFHNIRNRLARHPQDYGLEMTDIDALDLRACEGLLSASNLEALGRLIVSSNGDLGDRGLDEEKLLMADTFRQFADKVVKPLAEDIHRKDLIIPDEILDGVRELGSFGLSVPQRYGGLLPDDREDSLGMIVVTEELSRGSLGGAGSLITRPEIMARALLEGGTEEQKQYWLPRIAVGKPLCAIAITEPDFGSDVASIRLKATPTEEGWLLNGAKAWCTFAGKSEVLLTLARDRKSVV